MIYEVNDQSNYRQFFLVDFPEELKVFPEPLQTTRDLDGKEYVFVGYHKDTSNLYEYYKTIFNEVGKFEEVTFTLVEEVPYGAKKYRYHSCPI
jgi:hypothetical protein